MDRQIRIDGRAADDYVALADHLNGSRDFRGLVRLVTGPLEDGKLEVGVIEMLTGMVGVALTTSLSKWLNTRPDVTSEVTVPPMCRAVKLTTRSTNSEALKPLYGILLGADEQ